VLIVASVLRSGGVYDVTYVERLQKAVARHLRMKHLFVCLTDVPISKFPGTIKTVSLIQRWPGWWSKMEVFRLLGPVLYFDLDTVIVADVTALAEQVTSLLPGRLMMLRGFRPGGPPASGVMGWNGNIVWLTRLFKNELAKSDVMLGSGSLTVGELRFKGDQDWIVHAWGHVSSHTVMFVQDDFSGVVSYKRHVRTNGGALSCDTAVVCFHGRPRLPDVADKHNWVREHWG